MLPSRIGLGHIAAWQSCRMADGDVGAYSMRPCNNHGYMLYVPTDVADLLYVLLHVHASQASATKLASTAGEQQTTWVTAQCGIAR